MRLKQSRKISWGLSPLCMDLSIFLIAETHGFCQGMSKKIPCQPGWHIFSFCFCCEVSSPKNVFFKYNHENRCVRVVLVPLAQWIKAVRELFFESQVSSWHPGPPDCPRWRKQGNRIWDKKLTKTIPPKFPQVKSSYLKLEESDGHQESDSSYTWDDWSEEPWTSLIPGPCIGETANSLQDAGASWRNFFFERAFHAERSFHLDLCTRIL